MCTKYLHEYNTFLQLAQLPTPIHRWNLPGVPDGFEMFIKRDDLSGATLTGNKVYLLVYITYFGN